LDKTQREIIVDYHDIAILVNALLRDIEGATPGAYRACQPEPGAYVHPERHPRDLFRARLSRDNQPTGFEGSALAGFTRAKFPLRIHGPRQHRKRSIKPVKPEHVQL
jgi:hypothetical protein